MTARYGLTAIEHPAGIPTGHRDLLDTWAASGVPADPSTVELACTLLIRLWQQHRVLERTLTELTQADGQ